MNENLEIFEYIWKNEGCHGVYSCRGCPFYNNTNGCSIDAISDEELTRGPNGSIIWVSKSIREKMKKEIPSLIEEKKLTKEEIFVAMI